jgi:hypothetical protein
MVSIKNIKIYEMNLKIAFLNADLEKEIYME